MTTPFREPEPPRYAHQTAPDGVRLRPPGLPESPRPPMVATLPATTIPRWLPVVLFGSAALTAVGTLLSAMYVPELRSEHVAAGTSTTFILVIADIWLSRTRRMSDPLPWVLPHHPRLSITLGFVCLVGAAVMGALGSRSDQISAATVAVLMGVGFLLAGAVHRAQRRDLR